MSNFGGRGEKDLGTFEQSIFSEETLSSSDSLLMTYEKNLVVYDVWSAVAEQSSQ